MTSSEHSDPARHGVALHARGLQRHYGERAVLGGVSFDLQPGEVLSLLGPSGCGKTTLLKILAGLDHPTAGTLHFGARPMASAGQGTPPEQRGLGMVFQDYALWPHMSVRANVAFPLQMRKLGRAEILARVDETLALVGLQGMAERAPSSLSGGQQQRVALARAIVARPQLILFDEPLSNLDRDLRESLCVEMAQLLRKLGCTAVYVTHDHEEACAMADRVAVMMDGRIQQLCPPQALWSAPATREVAEFLKLGAVLPARRQGDAWQLAGRSLRALPAPLGTSNAPTVVQAGHLLIPHGAVSWGLGEGAQSASLQGHVISQQYRCGEYQTWVDAALGQPLQVASPVRVGMHSQVALSLDLRQLQWFPEAAVAA